MKQKGFTLIELLVVIAIIGLLASIIFVSVNNARKKARDARRKSDMHQLVTAIELYYNDHADYPPGEDDTGAAGQGIDFSINGSFIPQLINDGFLSHSLDDPGGYLYMYVFENNNPNNINIRTDACGASPLARAVLIFWLENGPSPDYRIWAAMQANVICFYP